MSDENSYCEGFKEGALYESLPKFHRINQKSDAEYLGEVLLEFRDRLTNLQQQIDQLKKLRNQHEDFVLKTVEVNEAGILEVLNRLSILEERARGKR